MSRSPVWAVLAALAGCAAYAQDTPLPFDAAPAVVELVRAGGMPAVLALIGWMLGRGGIPITIQLSSVDRALVQRAFRGAPSAPSPEA